MRLNLGCGHRKAQGYVNVDNNPLHNPDMLIDLDRTWPIETNSIDEIRASHIIEHLKDLNLTMDELYRVCRNGAKIIIRVPHISSLESWYHFHHHRFHSESLKWWVIEDDYKGAMDIKPYFKVKYTLTFPGGWNPLNHLFRLIQNNEELIKIYESTFLKALCPAWEIIYELEVVK